MTPIQLRNMARGGRGFHANRSAIIKSCLGGVDSSSALNDFLLHNFFRLPETGWGAFAFVKRDWELADLLVGSRSVQVEKALLAISAAYIRANADSVAKLYAMADTISGRLLKNEVVDLAPGTDMFTAVEAQSLFAFRVVCGSNQASAQAIKDELEETLVRGGWSHTRLMYPMINLVVHGRSADELDEFLSYFATGNEVPAEMLAIKLLLSDTAARNSSLAFKIFVGLMGHPFDLCDILLDHVEYACLAPDKLPNHLREALDILVTLVPSTRVRRVANAVEAIKSYHAEAPSRQVVERALEPYGVGREEADLLSRFVALAPLEHEFVADATRPLTILANMRAAEYPEPGQFRSLAQTKAIWSFIDGGRLIGGFMRSLYMVDRTAFEIEARDVLRLATFFGGLNAMLASAPSAMLLRRRRSPEDYQNVEAVANTELSACAPLPQRLWINELQWRLRRLEDQGRVQAWLKLVRSDAKVRPLYLTGINWPWVEEIILQQRLKPFRTFDGAYLLLLMEMESNSDPLRLKLVLDHLLSEFDFEQVVDAILKEYGDKAPAFLRRYLTSANLLSSGLATNHFSALDLRLKAIEEGVRELGFSPLLTKEMWESEAKLLTTELLLLNVNAGKFEVPWDAFCKDEIDRHGDLFNAFRSMSVGTSEEALTSLVETPKVFKSGRKEQYKYRRSNALLFHLVLLIVEDFLDHPAFGLEIILSGRFRHNIVLQELQAKLAGLEAINIPPVTDQNKRLLLSEFRPALERAVYAWCSRRMHTRRESKPEALFDLVPSPTEMTELLASAGSLDSFDELVRMVTNWLKRKLNTQVGSAGQTFSTELREVLISAFDEVRDSQLAQVTSTYRPEDARRIHDVALEALLRRVGELEAWFSGVDSIGAERVTLVELGHAAERLFENVVPGKRLCSQFDQASHAVSFEPHEVKVAFDLVRELAYNALKHGPSGDIGFLVSSHSRGELRTVEFSNSVYTGLAENSGTVRGHRYDSPDEALTRDRNSGQLKIAASAATLAGMDVELEWACSGGRYNVVIPLRDKNAIHAP